MDELFAVLEEMVWCGQRSLDARQAAARLCLRVGEQAFVVALQQQKGLGVAGDDIDQPAPAFSRQFRAFRRLAHLKGAKTPSGLSYRR
ncbi:MAG: hypothetical protein U5K38_09300 [Woeseiaceae bacterium]|nr:hypothetical protein [Woeseiaceae bacterium]